MLSAVVTLGASAALPDLPAQYTATVNWSECGNVGACVKPDDHRMVSYDGEKSLLAVEANSSKTGDTFHWVNSKATKYSWGPGAGGCKGEPDNFPVQSDWAWLSKNTTVGPTEAPCVVDKSQKCQVWTGPWPEQVTSSVTLYIRKDGGSTPDHLEMSCSLFPFVICACTPSERSMPSALPA